MSVNESDKSHLFAENNPSPVLRVDPEGKILLANNGARELFSIKEMEGMSWYKLCPNTKKGLFSNLIDNKSNDQIELAIKNSFFQFNVISIPEHGFVHLYGADITKRKKTELVLKENISEVEKKNRFVSIINSISTSIHQSISLEKVLERSVQSLSENLHYLHLISIYLVEDNCLVLKAHSGLPDWLIEKARSIPYPNGYMWKTIAAGVTRYSPDAKKEEVIGKTSERLDISSFLCIPLRDDEEIIGALSVSSKNKYAFESGEQELFKIVVSQIEDAISNAKLAEERKDLIDELESTLGKLKSTQQELIVQEKLASLGTLTAGIAHEIKNPLNFVNNFSDIALELTEELKEAMQQEKDRFSAELYEDITDIIENLQSNSVKINEHGKRADRIVQTMLQHSRDKKGDKHSTDINTLLDDDINLSYHGMRAQEDTFNVSIKRDFDTSIEKVSIVPQDISRVFLNILTNAFYETNKKHKKAGEDYSPEVIISTKNLDNEIEIKIRDNADGIPKDAQNKLFTPFFTTKPSGEGTGLGLSISYDIIVHEHGGSLRFETEQGKYTEFIITIPKS
ncbi:MAG: GAF domain-containing protein [Candidatus Dadabacteria bacterium]|nr:GAF domain-containing protein [Candidatus Dadabacteria bacterium]NIS07218.1 GAF domain-containing protein [Candidatus Dadabacteria bacterium]NIV40925.1 GAF domain-containing protein [Candidatus Dadabacteria bacterium]NIX14357.1 GAF domain-containing protein [Candidatus Dadabacteria bacterium]NIY20875.1 GAF domain-containing protein [Candidatus Dadabacteria bacterium]